MGKMKQMKLCYSFKNKIPEKYFEVHVSHYKSSKENQYIHFRLKVQNSFVCVAKVLKICSFPFSTFKLNSVCLHF